MAISNQQQNYNRTNSFNLSMLKGSGANTGRFVEDVTGVLVDIQVRDGYYDFTNPRTGEITTRPNSWIAVFEDGSLFSWPTYEDPQTKQVMPWSRFDPSIDLAQCAQNHIAIHLWKDDRRFTHLELAVQQPTQQANPSVANMTRGNWRQPSAPTGDVAPWNN